MTVDEPRSIRCGSCGHTIGAHQGGRLKLRVRVLAFGPDGAAKAPCPRCKRDTPVPVELAPEYRPAALNRQSRAAAARARAAARLTHAPETP